MFIKTIVKTDKKSGKRYEYLRLCESYRIGVKVRHRSIVTLGQVDEVDTTEKKKALADRIEELLKGSNNLFVTIADEEIESLAQRFYTKIRQKQQLKPESKATKGSKSSAMKQGKDFETIDIDSVVSEDVREIGSEWLCYLYEASRRLYRLKDSLEPFLSTKTSELFDLEDKIILYDLTNTYFEGRKQGSQLAQYGKSKERRSDAKLLALALVTNAEGFVKYSKIYKGNIADCKTLEKTVTELRAATTSSQNKPLVVIDAGISTDDNLAMLKAKGYDYLCVTRSKLKDYEVIDTQALIIHDKRENPIEIKSIKKKGTPPQTNTTRSKYKVKKALLQN